MQQVILVINRPNLQHDLWSKTFGYLLHPDIDPSGENLKGADVGTGNGRVLT